MPETLNFLIVEDSEDDAALLVRELEQGGYKFNWERVETAEAMKAALGRGSWDVVICDYVMPRFSGLAALELVKESGLDLPFIIVSGSMGEDTAVAAMKAGAHDYVMKDNLARLPTAIERELREAQERRARRRLVREMVEAKEYLENLVGSAGDAVVGTSMDGTITMWNTGAEELFGLGKEEALGSNIRIIAPGCLLADMEAVMALALSGEVVRGHECVRCRKDGSLVDVELTKSPITDIEGRIIGLCGIYKDIFERKRAEAEVKRVAEYFQNLVGSAGDAILAVDLEGKITLWNIGAERMFGYSREEALGQSAYSLLGGVDKSEEVRNVARRVFSGESVGPYEAQRYRKDGKVIWGSATATPLRNSEGEVIGVSVIFKDLTEEKRIREQLMQSEKMSSLGELISGVAHELNNPLSGVMGFSNLLLRRRDLDEEVRSDLGKIHDQAERAARIMRNLLTFARQYKPEKQLVAVNDLLRWTIELRAYEFRVNNIEVVEELDENLPQTVADPHQLKQMFLNIITNAEQAMLGVRPRGRLTVRSSQWQDGKRNRWIRIEIADDGPGIRQEHLSRIFDPFFTTKEVGKGTGLGLSICYGIIREHGGKIFAESEPGKGATFFVDLPIIQQEEETGKEEEPEEVGGAAGKAVVLVVDDEEVVLEMLRRALEGAGHRVETAVSGRQAMEKLREKDYDLIMMDYKMPTMGGKELYRWLQGEKPKFTSKVLVVTGDTVDTGTQRFLEETGLPHMSKPFDLEEMKALVDQLLMGGERGCD